MIDVAEAEALILANIPRLPARREALSDCVGRVLAEDIAAERDQPPFDRVTMDGIAIAYRDFAAGVRGFEVVGTQAAGAAPLALTRSAQCVEIMTGASLPRGADTVIPVERVTRNGARADVDARASVADKQFVHPRGSDRNNGDIVLRAGSRIGSPEMAVLASAGRGTVAVAALPHIAVVSTGDELVDVDEPLAPYQIRSSNDRAIEASLTARGLARVTRSRLRDDATTLHAALAQLDADSDALVLSGGVSMGQFDFVPAVLAELGARLVFHKIRQRPGKPLWFGISARGKPIFALPGNPVSTLVCATRYIVPALHTAAGLRPTAGRARAACGLRGSLAGAHLLPARDAGVVGRGGHARDTPADEHVGRLRGPRGNGWIRGARTEARRARRRYRRAPVSLVSEN